MRWSSACSSRWGLRNAWRRRLASTPAGRDNCSCLSVACQQLTARPCASPPSTYLPWQYAELVSEKNASLESLVRATAAAATEAGKLVRSGSGGF